VLRIVKCFEIDAEGKEIPDSSFYVIFSSGGQIPGRYYSYIEALKVLDQLNEIFSPDPLSSEPDGPSP